MNGRVHVDFVSHELPGGPNECETNPGPWSFTFGVIRERASARPGHVGAIRADWRKSRSSRPSWRTTRLRSRSRSRQRFASSLASSSFMPCPQQDSPTHIRVFEIYRDTAAYKSHLETAHFKKYKATTEKMVRSLKLVRTITHRAWRENELRRGILVRHRG